MWRQVVVGSDVVMWRGSGVGPLHSLMDIRLELRAHRALHSNDLLKLSSDRSKDDVLLYCMYWMVPV